MSAITRVPEIRGGEPCIGGTRVPIALLLAELIEGTITAFAVDRDLPITLCVAAAEEAIAEYAKLDEQAKLLCDIGRIVKTSGFYYGRSPTENEDGIPIGAMTVYVADMAEAEELYDLLQKAAEIAEKEAKGESDESDV